MKVDVHFISIPQNPYMGKYEIVWRLTTAKSTEPIDIDVPVNSGYIYTLFLAGLPLRFASRVFETWAQGLNGEKFSLVRKQARPEGADYVWLNTEQ